MAEKHGKPYLLIDLDETDTFQASLLLLEWAGEHEIKTLNIAGARASKDPKIYEKVASILESAKILENKRQKLSQTPQLKKTPKAKSQKRPATVEEAVSQLMKEMKLKDLNTLSKMPEDDLINLHFTIGMWIRNNYIYPRNQKLLESCREFSKDKFLHFAQMHMVIIKKLWKRLQETHKLKVVK